MMVKFDKTQMVIVTGASFGIGKGVALLINKFGAGVVAIDRNVIRLKEMKAKAVSPGDIYLESKDLSEDIESLPEFITSLVEKYGPFQGMASCAGTVDEKPLKLLNWVEIKRLYDVNLFALIFIAKGLTENPNNVSSDASMVFISGCAIYSCPKALSTYSGSKAALSASIRSIAKELAVHGIRANCILPSDIQTPMTDKSLGKEERLKNYPMGIGQVSDVANMIVYLLSDKSEWITGQDYVVDCGSFLK